MAETYASLSAMLAVLVDRDPVQDTDFASALPSLFERAERRIVRDLNLAPATQLTQGTIVGNLGFSEIAFPKPVFHGATLYAESVVPFGSSCSGETRTCSNGVLSGSNTKGSCSVTPAASCALPGGGSLAHDAAATFFETDSVPFGSSCVSQSRSCNDGALSGSYTHATCAPEAPASCIGPDGATIAHNALATYFASASVPYGGTCSSEKRACFNGTLSGSNTHPACSVTEGAQCNLPDGGKLASGASKDFYKTATVGKGVSCDTVKETRSCENGTLSGYAMFPSCSPRSTPGRAGAVESSACANIGAVVSKACDTAITGKKSAVLKTQDVKNHYVRIIKE